MPTTAVGKHVDARRLYWVGPSTVVASVLGVWIVQQISLAILPVPLPRFSGSVLSSSEPAIFTAILVTGGVLTFALVINTAMNPLRTFHRLALGILVASCIPNSIGLLWGRMDVGMLALMVLHVVAWAITVTMLTRLTVIERTQDAAISEA